MSVYNILLTATTVLDLICIATVIFFERKNPTSTIAWVLVIIFVPFIGFIIYAMFGSGFHINKRKKYMLKLAADAFYKALISGYISPARDKSAYSDNHACQRMIRYLEKDGRSLYTEDNAVTVYTDGQECFTAMMEDMRRATKHIHLLYYIIRDDELGRAITAILTRKAREGVEVRLIYDSLGSMLAMGGMFKELREAGGEVTAFSPLFLKLSSHLRMNYRNHRKITVVDGVIGYVGGMNIGDEYLGKKKRLSPWRDTQLRLTGSSVLFLQERFLLDWLYASDMEFEQDQTATLKTFFPEPREKGALGVQIVSSGPDTSNTPIKSGLLEIIYAAQKNVFIQTPYFTPDDSFMDALRIAAGSGVDVRVMVPGRSDKLLVSAATYSYAWQMLDAGIRIFRYDGFIHAKTMVFDGEAASIGTANIGTRSFALNFEINAFIYDRDFAARYEAVFLRDQEHCLELTSGWFTEKNPLTHAVYSASRLLAPLI